MKTARSLLSWIVTLCCIIPVITPAITIDGIFDDWVGINPIGKDPLGDVTGVDLTILKGCSAGNTLYVMYETAAAITEFNFRYKVYLRKDQESGGYHIPGFSSFHAQYMVESYWLYRYTGSGDDWSWASVGELAHGVSGSQVELAIPESTLGIAGGTFDLDLLAVADNDTTDDYIRWADGQNILVPAYCSPNITNPQNCWARLIAAAQAAPEINIIAIMNPYNGPGATRDTNYVNAVNAFRSAGGIVFGYVYTGYTARPINEVKTDMATYQSWYAIDGFFVDEMTSECTEGNRCYYRELYAHAKSLNSSYYVVGNPGTCPAGACYITADASASCPSFGNPAADTVVVFERDGTAYGSFSPAAWVLAYPADHMAGLVYAVSDVATMRADVLAMISQNMNYLYLTDDTLPDPWNTLPAYWTELVELVNWLQKADITKRFDYLLWTK